MPEAFRTNSLLLAASRNADVPTARTLSTRCRSVASAIRARTRQARPIAAAAEPPVPEHTRTKPHDFPILVDGRDAAERVYLGDQKADGVAADVDGRMLGHSAQH